MVKYDTVEQIVNFSNILKVMRKDLEQDIQLFLSASKEDLVETYIKLHLTICRIAAFEAKVHKLRMSLV